MVGYFLQHTNSKVCELTALEEGLGCARENVNIGMPRSCKIPHTVKSRRKVRFRPVVAEVVGSTFSGYDRTVIETEAAEETEDVLTWVSSALQNNTDDTTEGEKMFFLDTVLTLYATDFSGYKDSLVECVVQFALREAAIKEAVLLKLRQCGDNLKSSVPECDTAGSCGHLLHLISAHERVVGSLESWDKAGARPKQQEHLCLHSLMQPQTRG